MIVIGLVANSEAFLAGGVVLIFLALKETLL